MTRPGAAETTAPVDLARDPLAVLGAAHPVMPNVHSDQAGRTGDADTPTSVTSPAIHWGRNLAPRRLLGYLCVPPELADKEVEQLRRRLADFASREGFVLLRVFVDRRHLYTSGFTALFRALVRGEAGYVIVPALHHFAQFPSIQLVMKELIEEETGARVLVLHSIPEESA